MKFCSMILVVLLLMSAGVFAQAPETIVYQGRLANADGVPMTANDVDSVRFAIGTAQTGISILLWDTTVTDLDIDENGAFTVELGPLPSNVLTGSKRYLGISVNEDGEMSPRQVIASAPYAVSSADAPGIVHNFNSSSIDIGSSVTKIDSVEITVPMGGNILLQATGSTALTASGTGITNLNVCISATASFNYSNQCYIGLGTPSAGTYYNPISNIVVDPVASAGTYKYYLLGISASTTSDAYVYRTHFVATFIPNSFGTVDASTAPIFGNSSEPQEISE